MQNIYDNNMIKATLVATYLLVDGLIVKLS
jgi:hypothetical protein